MSADKSWGIECGTLSAYDADGFLGIQTDVDGSEGSGGTSNAGASPVAPSGGAPEYETIMPGGIVHRPLDPAIDASGNVNTAQAAQVLTFREGGRVWSMPLGDPRVVAILPTVEKGGTVVYSGCGSFLRLFGSGSNQGRISLFTTDDGTTDGYSVGVDIKPQSVTWIYPEGSKHTVDPSGFEWVDASGARMSLGTLSGALPMVDAAFAVMADSCTLDGELVNLGRASAALGRGAAVRADQLQLLAISPIAMALGQIATILATIVDTISAVPTCQGLAPLAAQLTEQAASVNALISPTVLPTMLYACGRTYVA